MALVRQAVFFLNPDSQRFRVSDDIQIPTFLWQGGDVCTNPHALANMVSAALEHDKYTTIREQLLAYSIHMPRAGNVAVHGVKVIRGILDGQAGTH